MNAFDDEVDALKHSILEERDTSARRLKLVALERALVAISARIISRRLDWRIDLGDHADDEPSLIVLHAETAEELGAVFFDNQGYAFEAEEDDFFSDVDAETDVEAFVGQLYHVLKVGLPAYEVEVEAQAETAT